jgi:hypothetical protein
MQTKYIRNYHLHKPAMKKKKAPTESGLSHGVQDKAGGFSQNVTMAAKNPRKAINTPGPNGQCKK